ncbi:MAG: DNA polymerase III subunit gamma/tau [Desulfamplus sp.]|nr:DNA polymerase III subunit gamma/tau [Desulfamplus sp.]
MSYKVLALKYRPQKFQDVIGQEHVTKTLSNAISSNRVAHAILLTGPRGTGKTTIARIMAKAMNCEQGPTPTPCNICKSCKSITSGNSADVFEIDGASNNSVDQIRELRANVTYMPTSSRLKIYIIDEVHMLSTAAFNALLKTLEEPPDHVMFIFATTESHKIPITILSRCQRHDLGRVKLAQISAHLYNLCSQENFVISKESIDLIASEADGSIRDSLSLLDRILSSSQTKEINHDLIINYLGIIDKKIIFDIADAILRHDSFEVLNIIDRINHLGLDLKKIYSAIIKHFRNMAVIKACSNKRTIVDITDSDRDVIQNMVSNCSVVYLTQLLNTLLKEEQLIKSASHTRTAIEVVMLKILQLRQGAEIDEIIKKLDQFAGMFREGAENNTTVQVQHLPKSDLITEDNNRIERKDAVKENISPFKQQVSIVDKSVIMDKSAANLTLQQSQHQQNEMQKREAMNHPLVNYARKIFSGNIVDIRIKEVKQPNI